MSSSSSFTIRMLGAAILASALGTTSLMAQTPPVSGGATGGGAIQGGSGAPGGGVGTPGAIVNGTTATGIGTSSTRPIKQKHRKGMKHMM